MSTISRRALFGLSAATAAAYAVPATDAAVAGHVQWEATRALMKLADLETPATMDLRECRLFRNSDFSHVERCG